MTSKQPTKGPFTLGLRVSFYVTATSAILLFVVLIWLIPPGITFLISVSVSLFLGCTVYVILRRTLMPRLGILYRTTTAIAEKKFDTEFVSPPTIHDELDQVLSVNAQAGYTVEGEIERLKRMENYRKEFIGDVSHELKTPTFAIQGFIETLLNGALEDQEVNRKFLKKAMRNVNRLIFLTNDLMEISKLETGELKIFNQEIPLKPVVTEIVDTLQYKADREQVMLFVESFDPSLKVRADRNQLRQVLNNLIDNAIKYNKAGGTVKINAREFPANPDKIEIIVEDTGLGIEEKDLHRVTERFYRVDKSRSREKGGTGLGLSIVKHIIEAHGEQFFMRSKPHVGSTFSFTMPKISNTPINQRNWSK